MKKDNTADAVIAAGPDLLVSPHILPLLMELFAGDIQQAHAQQEQLIAHLGNCHYCRTAVMVFLSYAQEYDRINNNPEEPTRDLLEHFAHISRIIEAREAREAQEFERLGAYAEAIVNEGRKKAARRFPDVAAHLNICPDCRTAVEETVASLTGEEKAD